MTESDADMEDVKTVEEMVVENSDVESIMETHSPFALSGLTMLMGQSLHSLTDTESVMSPVFPVQRNRHILPSSLCSMQKRTTESPKVIHEVVSQVKDGNDSDTCSEKSEILIPMSQIIKASQYGAFSMPKSNHTIDNHEGPQMTSSNTVESIGSILPEEHSKLKEKVDFEESKTLAVDDEVIEVDEQEEGESNNGVQEHCDENYEKNAESSDDENKSTEHKQHSEENDETIAESSDEENKSTEHKEKEERKTLQVREQSRQAAIMTCRIDKKHQAEISVLLKVQLQFDKVKKILAGAEAKNLDAVGKTISSLLPLLNSISKSHKAEREIIFAKFEEGKMMKDEKAVIKHQSSLLQDRQKTLVQLLQMHRRMKVDLTERKNQALKMKAKDTGRPIRLENGSLKTLPYTQSSISAVSSENKIPSKVAYLENCTHSKRIKMFAPSTSIQQAISVPSIRNCSDSGPVIDLCSQDDNMNVSKQPKVPNSTQFSRRINTDSANLKPEIAIVPYVSKNLTINGEQRKSIFTTAQDSVQSLQHVICAGKKVNFNVIPSGLAASSVHNSFDASKKISVHQPVMQRFPFNSAANTNAVRSPGTLFVPTVNNGGKSVEPAYTTQSFSQVMSPMISQHTSKSSEASNDLKALIQAGILAPGRNVLSLNLQDKTAVASLLDDGSIQGTGGEMFKSPSSWYRALYHRNVTNAFAKQKICYKGHPLCTFWILTDKTTEDKSTDQSQNFTEKSIFVSSGSSVPKSQECTSTVMDTITKCRSVLLLSQTFSLADCKLPVNFWTEENAPLLVEMKQEIDLW